MRLDDVIIVLARPSEPGNTGAVCRALKNMGLSRLRLAAPAYPAGSDPSVRGMPEGAALENLLARALHAADVWNTAECCETLEQALADCAISAGITRRRGRKRKTMSLCPRELAAFLKDKQGKAALVFGNERTGLEDGELSLCSLASHIPAAPEFPSLNLSHAVQIYAYELSRVLCPAAEVPGRCFPLTREENAALTGRISGLLETLGFYRHRGREEQEQFLRDFFSRAGLTVREGRYLENIAAKAVRLFREGAEGRRSLS